MGLDYNWDTMGTTNIVFLDTAARTKIEQRFTTNYDLQGFSIFLRGSRITPIAHNNQNKAMIYNQT